MAQGARSVGKLSAVEEGREMKGKAGPFQGGMELLHIQNEVGRCKTWGRGFPASAYLLGTRSGRRLKADGL